MFIVLNNLKEFQENSVNQTKINQKVWTTQPKGDCEKIVIGKRIK
jgi:hypothetical protein